MKKQIFLSLASILVLGLAVTNASALHFSNTITWDDDFFFNGNLIDDSSLGDPYPFTFDHTVTFDPEAASVDSASLSITHTGNSADTSEAWFLTDSGDIKIGDLGNSTSGWVEQSFSLDDSILSGVSGATWTT